MKITILFVLLALCLTSCNTTIPQSHSETEPVQTLETQAEVTETLNNVSSDVTPPPETESTPLHSDLFIQNISTEDVITYFNEVCLDAEVNNSGNPSLLQKWTSPISYSIEGEMTPDDKDILEKFCNYLNSVDGFPGISQSSGYTNLKIHFCTQDVMRGLLGDALADNDGAVTFWYNDNNEIYDEIICYRTDLEQTTRNSVILEEIYNGLGPIQDTALRQESIIYQGFTTPQWLHPLDELILKLLYHPDIKCGMNAAECEQVIRKLYY